MISESDLEILLSAIERFGSQLENRIKSSESMANKYAVDFVENSEDLKAKDEARKWIFGKKTVEQVQGEFAGIYQLARRFKIVLEEGK